MAHKIRKLKWTGKLSKESYSGSLIASTALGSFEITRIDPNYMGYTIMWNYCFTEYYDEGHFEVKTIKQAKEEAQKYFEKRALEYINDFIED